MVTGCDFKKTGSLFACALSPYEKIMADRDLCGLDGMKLRLFDRSLCQLMDAAANLTSHAIEHTFQQGHVRQGCNKSSANAKAKAKIAKEVYDSLSEEFTSRGSK